MDDATAEELGYIFEKVLGQKGVLDIYQTPIYMKKNRSGVLLTLLVQPEHQENVEKFLLLQTTTFGVRSYQTERTILQRSFDEISENNYNFQIKLGILENEIIKITPEYEDLKKIAEETGDSIRRVYEKANALIEEYKESKKQ